MESSTTKSLQVKRMLRYDDLEVEGDARMHLQHRSVVAQLLTLVREMQQH
jgi:hypothetical protein